MLVADATRYNPGRMPRRRSDTPGHAHDLTFSCFRRKPLLTSKIAKQLLADSVNAARVKHDFEVWAYVFMPEHVHLLIYPRREDYSISGILKSIKQSSSRSVIQHMKENNPRALRHLETGFSKPRYRFWQKGSGYDRNYWSPDEIRKQVDYIHNNPVRAGLVESPDEWYWSSARFWLIGERGPVIVERDSFPTF